MSLIRITAPTFEPVTLAEVKAHLRVTEADEDSMIAGYLLAARDYVETETRRPLVTQTWDYKIHGFPSLITLPKPPVQSVTSVKYLDSAGVEQTLAADQYRLIETDTGESCIVRAYGVIWPYVQPVLNCVTIRFVCGYGSTPGTIPESLRQAMLLLVGHWYVNREAVNVGNIVNDLPYAVSSLMFPYRVFY